MTLAKPVRLFCPACGGQHIDRGVWKTKLHRTHRCEFCTHEWRPAPWYTVGVGQLELSQFGEPEITDAVRRPETALRAMPEGGRYIHTRHGAGTQHGKEYKKATEGL